MVVAATTAIFTFRNNTSEQHQRNTDIIPKLSDIVPKVNIRFIRSVLGAYFDFRPQKAIKIRWKFAPFTENSLRSLKIRFFTPRKRIFIFKLSKG